uniref:hypothetical protein n=1 Tax=Aeromonas sp. Ne-1 TaxID=1675689 RepID=UPI0015639664|nr:hypothetical protein [Aeromonas sp. Ne-1]
MNFWKNKEKKKRFIESRQILKDTESIGLKIKEDLSNLLLFAPLEETSYLSLVETDILNDVYDFMSGILEDIKSNAEQEYHNELTKNYLYRLKELSLNRSSLFYRDYLVELIAFHVLNCNEYRQIENVLRYQKYLAKLYERLTNKDVTPV